jgi:hypothetical protein
MTTFERGGEGLARRVSRRRLLDRWAAAVFGMAAAVAVDGFGVRPALAQACAVTTNECHCRYDIAPGCPSTAGCTLDQSFYSTGCWCTLTCWYGGNRCGHHVCCDYLCPGIEGQCIQDTFHQDACPKKKNSIPRG